MSSKEQAHSSGKVITKQQLPQPEVQNGETVDQQIHSATMIQRAKIDPRSLSPRDIQQFQRTIGNRAVSRVLDSVTTNSPGELRVLGDLTVLDPMYVNGVDISEVPDFPKVLGISSLGSGYICPSVALTTTANGCNFSVAEAQEAANLSVVVKQGKHKLGESWLGNRDNFIHVSPWTFKDIKVTCSKDGNYTVYYDIDGTTYQKLVACEQEHLNDFSHAFKISAVEVAQKINDLVKNVYPNSVEAIHSLIKAVPIQLVPPEPMDLASWESHLKSVFVQLSDFSKERDRYEDHTPYGYDIKCDGGTMEATISPIFRNVHRDTNVIVDIQKISTAYDGHQLEDLSTIQVPLQGTKKKVRKGGKSKVYSGIHPAKNSTDFPFDGNEEPIPSGTECEVQQDGGQGKVWVRVTRQQLELDRDYWEYNPKMEHIYFTISLNNLE